MGIFDYLDKAVKCKHPSSVRKDFRLKEPLKDGAEGPSHSRQELCSRGNAPVTGFPSVKKGIVLLLQR